MNRLYYGDNLDVLREHVPDASVDLVYLDPPFNSNASYNILFKSPAGGGTDASIESFGDTFEWGPSASSALMDINQSGNHKLHVLMKAMKTAIDQTHAARAVRCVRMARAQPTSNADRAMHAILRARSEVPILHVRNASAPKRTAQFYAPRANTSLTVAPRLRSPRSLRPKRGGCAPHVIA